MATVTKLFTFATDAESFVATTAPQATDSWDGTVGNPAGSLKMRMAGRNKSGSSYWEWTGTWEALGVPVGVTITSLQLSSGWTRVSEYATAASSTIGPYELRDSTGTTVLGTLWPGRTASSTDAGTAIAAQTAVTIAAGYQDSATTIKVRLSDTLATAASNSAAISAHDDQVSLVITYSLPVNTSISASDTAAVTISGTSSIVPTGGGPTPIAASDTIAVTITENINITDPTSIQKTGTEGIALGISEIGQPSTIVDLGVVSSAASSTPGTTLALVNSSGAAIPAGTLMVFSYISDNPASTTAPTFSSTPIAGLGAINWFYGAAVGSGVTTTAGSGIWTWSFYCYTTASIAAGATIITTTWSTSVNTRAAIGTGYAGTTGAPFGVSAYADTKGQPSANTTIAPQVGDLVIGIIGAESATATGDADRVGGQWKALQSVATFTGGADDTNIIMGHQSKVPYSYNKQVYNPIAANDSVAHVGVFRAAYRHRTSVDGASLSISETATIINTTTGAPSISTDTSGISVVETSSINVLGTFKTAIANRETKRANLAMLGASITEGYPTTREKYITSYLDTYLRNTYPTSNNPQGLGYFGLSSVAVYQAGTSPYISYAGTGAVYEENSGRGGMHTSWSVPQGQTGIVYFATGPEGAWTSFDINCITGPTGSATGGAYVINGVTTYFSNYSATTQLTKIHVSSAVPAGSSVAFGAGNSGTLDLIINSVTSYQGDESKGITAHSFGHGGYTAAKWLRIEVGRPVWIDDIIAEDPDLFIIGEIGPNDANAGLGSVEFKKQYGDLIDYIRGSGYTKPILAMAFIDGSAGGGMAFIEPWQNYVNAIQQVAKEKGLAFLNLYGDIPNPPGPLYYSDNVHGATDGSLYSAIAQRIVNTIADIVVASSDTAAVTITETSSVSITTSTTPITTSDSSAATITETSSIIVTSSTADTSSVAVTESRTLASTLARTDTAALSIGDTSSSGLSSTRPDVSAITISESSVSTLSGATTDTASIAVADSSTLAIVNGAITNDTTALTITDASAIFNSPASTETTALAIAESVASSGTAGTVEATAITITESTAVAILSTLPGTDISSITIAETRTIYNPATTTDTAALTIGDTSAVQRVLPTTDTSSISAAETSIISTGAVATDTVVVSIAEASSLAIVTALSTTDTASVAIADTTKVVTTLPAADTSSISAGEITTSSIQAATIDTTSISIGEIRTATLTSNSIDTASLTIIETSGAASTITASDTGPISIAEVTNFVISTGAVTNDAASISIAEGNALAGISASADTASITIVEASASSGTATTVDAADISIADTSTLTILSTLPGTDISSVAIAEATTIFITQAATDTSALVIIDNSTPSITLAGSDSSALTIAETRAIVSTSARNDTASVTITESRTLAITNAISRTDTSSISIADTRTLAVSRATTDSTALTIADSSVSSLAATGLDASALGITESTTSGATIDVLDNTGLAIDEATSSDINTMIADDDSSNIAIDEETSGFVITITDDTDTLVIVDDSSNADALAVSSYDISAVGISEQVSKSSLSHYQAHAFIAGHWLAGVLKIFTNNQWVQKTPKVWKGIWT